MARAVKAAFVGALALIATPLEWIRYVDIAAEAGLTVPNTFGGREQKEFILETTGTGVAIFDYDGDGWNDVFIANGATMKPDKSGPHLSQLYRNDGQGHFRDVAREAGINLDGWAQAVCVGDYDNDGRPDLFVTYYGHNVLYRNLGNGRFEDATAKAGLPTTGSRYGSGCTFLDYDRDGHLDVFVANYVELDLATSPKPGANPLCEWKGMPVACGPRALPPGHNALYRNNGDGTFTDVSERAGILKPGGRTGLGAVAADFDNDGWPDIYVACDQTPSLLYRNQHDGTFVERGVEAGVAFNFDGALQSGMGIAVADFDGDGRLDIAKTNFSGDLPSLFHNDDGKFFTDISREAGLGAHHLLGWGVLAIDLDEDGWKDLVMANGHVYPEVDRIPSGERYRQRTLAYRNLGNGKFADITDQAGPGFEPLRPSRGMASGDLDGDGRPEIVIVNMNDKPALLKNTAPRQNWIALELVGTKSNRSAIGARVTVEAGGHQQIDEVLSGGSYYSQSDLTLYFGLGKARVVDRIHVRWPRGLEQDWKDVAPGHKIRLTEGQRNREGI